MHPLPTPFTSIPSSTAAPFPHLQHLRFIRRRWQFSSVPGIPPGDHTPSSFPSSTRSVSDLIYRLHQSCASSKGAKTAWGKRLRGAVVEQDGPRTSVWVSLFALYWQTMDLSPSLLIFRLLAHHAPSSIPAIDTHPSQRSVAINLLHLDIAGFRRHHAACSPSCKYTILRTAASR